MSDDESFRGKLRLQARVLSALMRREITTRYGRTAGGYVWAIVDPAAVVIVLTIVFSFIARRPPLGESFALFFATGYLGFLFYRATVDYAGKTINVNRPLFSFPRVTTFDAFAVRIYLQLLTTAAAAIIVLVAICVTIRTTPEVRPVYLALSIASGVSIGAGVAMTNAVLYLLYPLYERVFTIVSRPLFILSGIFYLPESLPNFVIEVLSWNPLIHVTSLFRKGFYPEYDATVVDYWYLWFWSVGSLALGLLLVRQFRYIAAEQ